MARIELQRISRHYKAAAPKPALERMLTPPIPKEAGPLPQAFSIKDLSLEIPDGSTMVIVGPSGCGKTTLLRLIAGLDAPETGRVCYDGEDVAALPTGDRGIGMVFQNYALFPHFSGKKNVLTNFFFRKKTPELDAQAAAKLARTSELMGVEIDWLLDKAPKTLSGGEKQRVAIARCITRDPKLFLMDEPFSNLDAKLRERYRLQLKRLLREFSVTTVYVTHDQMEARILADFVAVMRAGRIEQVGSYETVYAEPANIFVADFLNMNSETPAINLVPGELLGTAFAGQTAGFRCEETGLSREAAEGSVPATVLYVKPASPGANTVVHLQAACGELYAECPAPDWVGEGVPVWVRPRWFHVFDGKTGARVDTVSVSSME